MTEGSMFKIRNSMYRVMTVTFNISTVSIIAAQYNTYDEFETTWAGQTYAQFEAFWGIDNYTYEDFSIAPLTIEW